MSGTDMTTYYRFERKKKKEENEEGKDQGIMGVLSLSYYIGSSCRV